MKIEDLLDLMNKRKIWYIHSHTASGSEYNFIDKNLHVNCKINPFNETFEFVYVLQNSFKLSSGEYGSIKNEQHFEKTRKKFFDVVQKFKKQ